MNGASARDGGWVELRLEREREERRSRSALRAHASVEHAMLSARRKFDKLRACVHARAWQSRRLVHTEGRHVKDGERGFAGVNEYPFDVTLSLDEL